MSERIWRAVKTKVRKTGVAKTKIRRGKRRSRKEIRRKGGKTENEVEKRKDNRGEENSRRVGDLR